MTKEEKDLLLKDLCARLPYQLTVNWNPSEGVFKDIESNEHSNLEGWLIDAVKQGTIKPYLRPMSSMTSKEWVEFCDCSLKDEASFVMTKNRQMFIPLQNREDYLNSKHFDYRGLIEKGLALEAPEGMYN